MQGGFAAFYHQRMPGIVTTLEAHHSRHLIGQQINNLTLAFITPLGAQHYNIFTHDSLSGSPLSENRQPVFRY
jgi:hypothetical protein